jgi:hypothetical protein
MEKSQVERLKECVDMVRQLEEVGVTRDIPGRRELDVHIQEYVKQGIPWSGRIRFPELHRFGDVILPRYARHHVSIDLKFVPSGIPKFTLSGTSVEDILARNK